MKKLILGLAISLFGCYKGYHLTRDHNDYAAMAQTGDLIFQTQVGRTQSLAIQASTLSPYNHVGIVSVENGKVYVYEAAGNVAKVKLERFTGRRGTGDRFVVYRHDDIDSKSAKKVRAYARKNLGKGYDTYLRWDSSRMYCSELAYKALDHAGLELEQPRKMKDLKFALAISKHIPNGYKRKKFKLEDSVVAPSHLSRDGNMYRVYTNW